jgi:hypothetical protein
MESDVYFLLLWRIIIDMLTSSQRTSTMSGMRAMRSGRADEHRGNDEHSESLGVEHTACAWLPSSFGQSVALTGILEMCVSRWRALTRP